MDFATDLSLQNLLDAAIAASAQREPELHQEALGALALLLGSIIRHQDSELFRAALRAIAESVDDFNAKWIIKASRNGLSPEQLTWLNDQIQRIMG